MKGLCKCGCGERTNIANRSDTSKKWIKGEPLNYVFGHNSIKEKYAIDKNGCWVWKLTRNDGYPYMTKMKKTYRAHRYFYKKYKGEIPKGLELDHLCKNRACVNPDHLEAVTSAENARRSSATKLTLEKVIKIRELYAKGSVSLLELAKSFNVSKQNIFSIVKYKTWKV